MQKNEQMNEFEDKIEENTKNGRIISKNERVYKMNEKITEK